MTISRSELAKMRKYNLVLRVNRSSEDVKELIKGKGYEVIVHGPGNIVGKNSKGEFISSKSILGEYTKAQLIDVIKN